MLPRTLKRTIRQIVQKEPAWTDDVKLARSEDRLVKALAKAAQSKAELLHLFELVARYAATHSPQQEGTSGYHLGDGRPIHSPLFGKLKSLVQTDLAYTMNVSFVFNGGGVTSLMGEERASDKDWRQLLSTTFYFARRSLPGSLAANAWNKALRDAPSKVREEAMDRASTIARRLSEHTCYADRRLLSLDQ